MDSVLLDTSAVSANMRGDATTRQLLHSFMQTASLWMSTVSDGEIRYGILRLPEGHHRQALLDRYDESLSELTGLLPVTAQVSRTYALLRSELEARGQPLADNDLWIASTAVAHDLTLVTTDRHFDRVPGLSLAR